VLAETTRFGIAIPQAFASGAVDVDAIRDVIHRAEELGFGELWAQEMLLTRDASLDGLELLSYAAAMVRSATLGLSALILPRHQPVVLAKRLATIDHLSRGRLIVGVALGGGHEHFARAGFPADRPLRRFNECLAVLKAVWASEEPYYEGVLWQVGGVPVAPRPRRKPHPPIWFGGQQPPALARAARHGDGWMGGGASTSADFARAVRVIRDELATLGRDPAGFTISKRVYIALDDDAERGRRRLAACLRGIYGVHEPPIDVAVAGPPERCAAALAEIVEAGASHLVLNPLYDEVDQIAGLAELVGLGSG
jgi:probable F420-dependent oxidoreductase